ncbi:MAG TPA: hypothetical protein VLE23_09295 [Geminicoccaceae bacterium]|nr:hypothetical protein [Geminicoccaceae bacterium]
MKLVKKIVLSWIQFREFQAALAAFQRLSNHELSEAGVARDDIVRLAFEEAERRTATRGQERGQDQVDALRGPVKRDAGLLRS